MKYAKLSFYSMIASSLILFPSIFAKLYGYTLLAEYGLGAGLLMALASHVFFFISLFKEKREEYFFWIMFALFLPGLAAFIYYFNMRSRFRQEPNLVL